MTPLQSLRRLDTDETPPKTSIIPLIDIQNNTPPPQIFPKKVVVPWAPGNPLELDKIINGLFHGDCLDVMPLLPKESFDLILCDLPYGTTQNKWDSVIDLDRLWECYRRVLKPKGAIVLTSQGVFTAKLILSNEAWFKYKFVWEKSKPTNFLNARKQPLRKHEDVCVFYKKQPVYNPQMGNGTPYDKGIRKDQLSGSYGDFQPVRVHSTDGRRFPTDVVYFKTAESEGSVWHPTQKPVSLARYLIRTFTNPGDLVLDNAFGSGSFLIASLMEGRNFVGIEKNDNSVQFKSQPVDCIRVTQNRLSLAWEQMSPEKKTHVRSDLGVIPSLSTQHV